MQSIRFLLLFILIVINKTIAQNYISADPFSLLEFEKESYLKSISESSFMIRPLIINDKRFISISMRSEAYHNNNAPNLENIGNRFIGKGFGSFNTIKISYRGKFIYLSIEPFYQNSQNKEFNLNGRDGIFSRLNDNKSSFSSYGFRETQFYLHYKGIGFGYSNANMWWGPGFHNSLTMTNNTAGFPHFMIGTIKEKRNKKLGFNLRYIFSKLDKTIGDPYFTAIVGNLTFHTDPKISLGFSRNYLSGGLPTDRPFTSWDAAVIVFEQLLVDTKINEYPTYWDAHDPWDQLISIFISVDFPLSKLKLYSEIGTNDHRQNLSDLRAHPDHALAHIIGIRKYGLFNNDNLLFGIEYTNLILGKFWKYRATPNWYNRDFYDYSSYDGRRWAAHSGSDSDDLFIYFGYKDNKWSLIPSFNYERHGVLFSRPPEVKIEIRFDLRYHWKDYNFNILYEREWLEHAGFVPNKWRNGTVIWFGIERDLTSLLSNKLGFINN